MLQDRESGDQGGPRVELAGSSTAGTKQLKPEGRPTATPPLNKAAAPAGLHSAPADPQISERAEIARRVAAFRERQLLLKRQREEYYDAVLAKTRAELRSDPRLTRR